MNDLNFVDVRIGKKLNTDWWYQ